MTSNSKILVVDKTRDGQEPVKHLWHICDEYMMLYWKNWHKAIISWIPQFRTALPKKKAFSQIGKTPRKPLEFFNSFSLSNAEQYIRYKVISF